MYENCSLLSVLHFRLFKFIFNKSGHKEKFYHYNPHIKEGFSTMYLNLQGII